jgi:uncharacterized protein (DUF2249 family)
VADWTKLSIPVKGKLLLQFDHEPDKLHTVAEFEHRIPAGFSWEKEEDGRTPMIKLKPEFSPRFE